MAKRKEEMPAPGAPAWMATFGDLMNLLLCFFVLLFAMSNVDAEKFEQIAASLSNSFSILPNGGSSIGEGKMISNGVSQLNELSIYSNNMGESSEKHERQDALEEVEEEKLKQSEEMSEQIEEYLEQNNLQELVEIDFTSQYVVLTLNGTLLFDSGKAEIRQESISVIDSLADLLQAYPENVIEIEGHTDNVPINTAKYKSNKELSSFRALAVADYLIEQKGIDPVNLKWSGRAEFDPISDNGTPEGRAQNRRVEIKVYNQLSSN